MRSPARRLSVLVLLPAALCLLLLPLSAGEGEKEADAKAKAKDKAAASNPFLAAAGDRAREGEGEEPVTLSNEDLDDSVGMELSEAPATAPAKQDDDKPLSFSNEVLKKMFGDARDFTTRLVCGIRFA